jgi:hypothetical protein
MYARPTGNDTYFEDYSNRKCGKPQKAGRFNPDYFAVAELEEMNNLIEIFARQRVGAAVTSDASHQAIKAWKKTFPEFPNQVIDPIKEFDRDITDVPEESLHTEEIRYLMHRTMAELAL